MSTQVLDLCDICQRKGSSDFITCPCKYKYCVCWHCYWLKGYGGPTNINQYKKGDCRVCTLKQEIEQVTKEIINAKESFELQKRLKQLKNGYYSISQGKTIEME